MKIGVIIPSRGNDRPRFLKNCMAQLARQTILPTKIELMDYEPESDRYDITQRYRRGYDNLRGQGLDVIAWIEDDEWYANDYLEKVTQAWHNSERPDIFGTTYTHYYHLKLFAWFTMHHHQRSSAMSTLIKPDLDVPWPPDFEAFTDEWLFKTMPYKLWTPKEVICLGMKHGVGKCGGRSHVDKLHRYENKDIDKKWIRSLMDDQSFEFFSNYFKLEL